MDMGDRKSVPKRRPFCSLVEGVAGARMGCLGMSAKGLGPILSTTSNQAGSGSNRPR